MMWVRSDEGAPMAKPIRVLAIAVLAIASLFPIAAVQAQAPARETLAADTPRTTPAGVTFTGPTGWGFTKADNLIILDAPEGDSKIAIVDIATAADASAAVAAAWPLFKSGEKRPLKVMTPMAAINGWDERQYFDYETSPNERATVYAIAERAGKSWTVVLVDAKDGTFEKRRSQFGLAIASLRPKGYTRENFAGKKANPLDAPRIAILRDFVAQGMKELGVPGVALAFIDGGKIVYEGGLGVRELGKPEPIDANTLFIAASNTKGMTTMLLAKLADEKKLRWDQPVTELFPAFRLGDAETTKNVLVKHLICACTGMPRQDLEWIFEFKDSTPDSIMKLLGTMQPTSRFGQLFQYSNLMASAAGYVGGSLVYPKREIGAAYDDAMAKKIFAPLGMTRTTFDFKKAQRGNYARTHSPDIDGATVVAPMADGLNRGVIPARPAGGVWTSAHDFIRYVQMELAKGKLPDGKQLVSEENVLARRAPQVLVSEDIWYGMGLFIDKRWGIPIIRHGGDLAGYHSDMMWLPEHDVGAIILTNGDRGGALRGPLLRRMVELLFDGKPEADQTLMASAKQLKATLAKERERLVVPPAAEYVDKLAARYSNKDLGGIDVKRSGTTVTFDFGEWSSPVASRKNDDGTISFITIVPSLAFFDFVVADQGGKRRLIMRDAQHEYVFSEL
jgi:CubicO group peptidase (beta-lactamase class C family)